MQGRDLIAELIMRLVIGVAVLVGLSFTLGYLLHAAGLHPLTRAVVSMVAGYEMGGFVGRWVSRPIP